MWNVLRVNVFPGDGGQIRGISDLDAFAFHGTWNLYVTTRTSPGITALTLDPDAGTAVTFDRQPLSGSGLQPEAIAVLTFGNDTMIAALGRNPSAFPGYSLTELGDIDAAVQFAPSEAGQSSLIAVAQVSLGAKDFVIAGHYSDTALRAYSVTGTFGLVLTGTAPLPGVAVSAVATATLGARSYVMAGSGESAEIFTFDIDADGALTRVSPSGPELSLGIAGVTQMETVSLGSQTFLIVAAAGSSTLSVLRLDRSGDLTPVDHVFDGRNTRFQSASELKVMEHENRVFVLAAGSDDGFSLFQLLPEGQLILRASRADGMNTTLDDVSGLAMIARDNSLDIYASAENEPGITQFRVDLRTPGVLLVGTTGADELTGLSRDDVLSGGRGNDVLKGGAGDDVLVDGTGSDTLRGAAGADLFVLRHDDETDHIQDFEAGIDRIDLSAWQFLRNFGQLEIQGIASGARISYRNEVLIVTSRSGEPLGAADFDASDMMVLNHGFYPALPRATPTSPTDPAAAERFVEGTDRDETLTGSPWNDTLSGNGGNDILIGRGGSDDLRGGSGTDIADYSTSAEGVTINLMDMAQNQGDAKGDVFSSVEGIRGSAFADRITGHSANDRISGGAGADLLRGGAGADSLVGNNGNDRIWGQDGNDRLGGGQGADRLLGAGGRDVLLGDAGRDFLSGGSSEDLISGGAGPDRLVGGSGRDKLNGGGGDDRLSGGSGNDTLLGSGGRDRLLGGGGDDRLRGETGRDLLAGGTGRDVLAGGGGPDRLDGGPGNDILSGGGGPDVFVFGGGVDRITDFRNSADTLHMLPSLWGGGRMTADQLVATFCEQNGSGLVFDFGRGNVLRLDDCADSHLFVDDLTF